MLEKLEILEVDEEDTSALRLKFPPAPNSGKYPVIAEELTKDYDGHIVFQDCLLYTSYHHKSVMHTTIDYYFYFFSSSGVTLSNLNSNAFTEINISFTEIPNEITNSNKATPNV